jgi:hypothetical protein
MMRSILIASTSADHAVYGPVVDHLVAAGDAVIVVDVDAIASGAQPFELFVDADGALAARYDGISVSRGDIGAAWYRHPDLFGYDLPDRGKQMCLTREADALLDGLWAAIPETVWLNAPARIRWSQIKLLQLVTAAEVGFCTPLTLIANRWPSILKQFQGKQFIAKMPQGLLYDDGEPKSVYTTVLDPARLDEDTAATIPFPAILQSYIEKRREWRITLVGDEIFAAVIHTTSAAKDDWRRHQLGDDVSFEAAKLPTEETRRCLAYLDRYGLRFGAFDLIEDTAGRFVFLELNPNGQYLWLEQQLGMNISAAMAGQLSRIARGNA